MLTSDIEDIARIVEQVLEESCREIIENHERAGQVASGKTRDSLKHEVVTGVSGVTGTIYGRKYFAALETGSKPWKKQYAHPPKPFVNTIAQWMADKGIEGVSAYLVARKIMREGTKLYREGGRKDIFTTSLEAIQERIEQEISSLFSTIIEKTITL